MKYFDYAAYLSTHTLRARHTRKAPTMSGVHEFMAKMEEVNIARRALESELPFDLPLYYSYSDGSDGVKITVMFGYEEIRVSGPHSMDMHDVLTALDDMIENTIEYTELIRKLNAHMQANRLDVQFKDIDYATLEMYPEHSTMVIAATMGDKVLNMRFSHHNVVEAKLRMLEHFAAHLDEPANGELNDILHAE